MKGGNVMGADYEQQLANGKQIVVVATRNAGKKREFEQMLAPLGMEVRSLADYPDLPEIEETGTTFTENAELKARAAAEVLRVPVIADDSGITVTMLDGAPGVYSARYAGEDASDEANIRKLLDELAKRGVTEGEVVSTAGGERMLLSEAAFVCSIVYLDLTSDAGEVKIVTEGRVEGYVVDRPAGDGGFGYDPLFYVPEYRRTMAELSSEEKHAISHRGQALRQLIEQLRSRR